MMQRSILSQVKVVFGLSAACCLLFAAEACNAVAARSCEAITDDIGTALAGGDVCRSSQLILESFDAGCTVVGAGSRDDLAAQVAAACAG